MVILLIKSLYRIKTLDFPTHSYLMNRLMKDLTLQKPKIMQWPITNNQF